jgi:hypothetical protein
MWAIMQKFLVWDWFTVLDYTLDNVETEKPRGAAEFTADAAIPDPRKAAEFSVNDAPASLKKIYLHLL